MDGPEHYRHAEAALEASDYQRQAWGEGGRRDDYRACMWELGRAQVQATLALAAATALAAYSASGMPLPDRNEWARTVGVEHAEAAH